MAQQPNHLSAEVTDHPDSVERLIGEMRAMPQRLPAGFAGIHIHQWANRAMALFAAEREKREQVIKTETANTQHWAQLYAAERERYAKLEAEAKRQISNLEEATIADLDKIAKLEAENARLRDDLVKAEGWRVIE